MIFNFLRQFLKDDEFEQTKIELAEARLVLREYKGLLQSQKETMQEEKEKVDPDFLVFVWATVGFAFWILSQSAQKAVELQHHRTWPFYIWIVFALFAIAFIVNNSMFALELTQKYANSKSNRAYIWYTYYVIAGALILVFGVFGLAYLK